MPRISLRDAVKSVQNHISEFKDILGNNLEGLMIEETELSEDGKFWLITVGFNRKIDPREQNLSPLAIGGVFAQTGQQATIKRDYKIFKVDSSTGEVLSMKIYKL